MNEIQEYTEKIRKYKIGSEELIDDLFRIEQALEIM